MATDLLEESQLPAMMPSRLGNANFISDSNYSGFLGLGKKQKAKKVPVSPQPVKGVDETFKEKMINLYNSIKGDAAARNEALSNIETIDGITISKEISKRYGTPNTQEQLRNHNVAFKLFEQYSVKSGMGCEDLYRLMADIDAELDASTKSAGTGTKQRISNRYITILNDLRKEAKKAMNKQNCDVSKAQAESLSASQEVLSQIGGAGKSEGGTSTTTYILYGLGAVILGVGIYMLVKKD